MPYTDAPPPFVLPMTREGYRYASENIDDDMGLDVEFCSEYKDGSDMTLVVTDLFLPRGIPPCKNRRREGARHNNWCYRCMAGFPVIHLSDKEKELSRDSMYI